MFFICQLSLYLFYKIHFQFEESEYFRFFQGISLSLFQRILLPLLPKKPCSDTIHPTKFLKDLSPPDSNICTLSSDHTSKWFLHSCSHFFLPLFRSVLPSIFSLCNFQTLSLPLSCHNQRKGISSASDTLFFLFSMLCIFFQIFQFFENKIVDDTNISSFHTGRTRSVSYTHLLWPLSHCQSYLN